MWLLSKSDHGDYRLTEFYNENEVPPYAILSHRCLQPDAAEPTFQDLRRGLGQEKPGHKKVEFCGEQAERDGLEYFWVDTCCINKENHSEHQHALRSMFHWYRRSEKCYVYLNDVRGSDTSIIPRSWDSEFYKSSWFTRGWTLQELLAPRSVEFFTYEGARLGSKILLAEQISEITRIPPSALNGRTLSHFSREERFGWSQSRETAIPEDRAYALLGIFGVDMPIAYGEGAGGAIRRLEEAIERRNICIRDIRLSDPRDDKKRIEEAKGGLLKEAYCWVLQTSEFQQWRSTEDSSILWIKGDPGKGKTMLLCGMIEELEKFSGRMPVLSYFFCQATDQRADNATAVLRGLLYMFVHQWPSLVSHFQAKHDTAGKTLFEDVNAWIVLASILRVMLGDPLLNGAYIIVDALDECSADRHKLLDFIVAASSICAQIKWIVSSRNWPDVEKAFRGARQVVKLSLELNEDSVSAAVTTYIHFKIKEFAQRNRYDKVEQDAVQHNLECNAHGTFLWVALVCQELLDVDGWEAKELSQEFPPGLEPFYRRMLEQILHSKRSKLCKEVLAIASVVRRPLSLEEMSALVSGGPSDCNRPGAWVSIVGDCGSFLTVQNKVISFVHQSAKDFLVRQARSEIFPNAVGQAHHDVCTRSLSLIMKTLRRDIYKLEDPGTCIDEVNPLRSSDPLAAARYSCVYWIEHLQESMTTRDGNILRNGSIVDKFLRGYYLYWLEASSLNRNMAEAQVSMSKLETLLQNEASSELFDLAHDALRFIMYHKLVIERFPLQTYVAAILFTPEHSTIKNLYAHEKPKQIKIVSPVPDRWNTCLQTLEGHSSWVYSIVFSHDLTQLASASEDHTIKVWDASSGACLKTLEGHGDLVRSVVFSHDSTRLASASADRTIKVWDASSGACLQTLEGHKDWVSSVVFSHDSTRLASASTDRTIKVWDASSGACLRVLEGHSEGVSSVVFSHDSTKLASGSWDHTIKVWDASSGACLQTLEGHKNWVSSVVFSHDSTRLASASWDSTIMMWDASSGVFLQAIDDHRDAVTSIVFSRDSTRLASASWDRTIKVWDASSGACLKTLEGHGDLVNSVVFLHDSTRLASASADRTIKVWDASSGACLQALEGHSERVSSVVFSHDSTKLASGSWDRTIKVWDTSSGACLQTLEGHKDLVSSVVFSHDSTRLASASADRTIKVWDASSGACLQTLEGYRDSVSSTIFSRDSTWIASSSWGHTIKIWDASSGTCLQTFEGHGSSVSSVVFSHDSTRLASASWDRTIKVWDASSGACLKTLEGHRDLVSSVVFSHDSTRLASASADRTIKVWDASSGACLQTLEGYSSSVSSVKAWNASGGACLQLERCPDEDLSSFFSYRPGGGDMLEDCQRPQGFPCRSIDISRDESWVTRDLQKALWLPSEYRPLRCSVTEKIAGIGTSAGRVWMCRFEDGSASQNL